MLTKEIIDYRNDKHLIGVLPTIDIMRVADIVLIDYGDKYLLLKNRFSDCPQGILYTIVDGEYKGLYDLEYKEYSAQDFNYINKNLPNLSTAMTIDKIMENPYIIYKGVN